MFQIRVAQWESGTMDHHKVPVAIFLDCARHYQLSVDDWHQAKHLELEGPDFENHLISL